MVKSDDMPRERMVSAFDKQIGWCRQLGSPFTADLLSILRDDLRDGGTTAELLAGWPGDPATDAVPLRLSGALHALALSGSAPAVATFYPPRTTATPDADVLERALIEHRSFIADFIQSPPQTNEVGRSAVLLGGFLEVAQRTGLPLTTLEVGASAGLNLNWDRFFYQLGDASWGNRESPVRLAPQWKGTLPPLDATLSVASRHGCDIAPVPITSEAERLSLMAYVWADQRDRLARLNAAIEIALQSGTKVEKADAEEWLRAKLRSDSPGRARVIYHSTMWQYLAKESRDAIHALIEETGKAADRNNPLAWLRFEPDESTQRFVLTLSLWPEYGARVLAAAHPHGASVEWMR